MSKYALLIGVSSCQNQDAIAPSPSARYDVEALGKVLLHPDLGGFSEIKPVLDPDRLEMEEAIEEFFRKCSSSDLAVLFFSGAGIRDERGKTYFATKSTRRNCDGDLIRATAVSAGSLQDILTGSRAHRQVMILECGFAESAHPGLMEYPPAPYLRSQLAGQGRVILLGSGAGTLPTNGSATHLSPYTHFLVQGITTGEADQNHDGEVSVQELHDYASLRVQAALPHVHPEMIVLRDEDSHINLARVLLDPRSQYREAVERCLLEDGKLSPVARILLDQKRLQLRLAPNDAWSIENDVLQPYREYAEKLHQYRRALLAALETEYPLRERLLHELNDLQTLLGLSDEELMPIQQEVTQPFADRAAVQRQQVEQYEHSFREAIALEYPLQEATRQRLVQLQHTLGLHDADIQAIEARVLAHDQAQRESYHRHLKHYEQAFTNAVESAYPLDQATQVTLKKLQHSLELHDSHVAKVEQRVLDQYHARKLAYAQAVTQYQQAFQQLIAKEPVLAKSARDQLQQLQGQLGLHDDDVAEAEKAAIAQLTAAKAAKQREYQNKLKQYERAYAQKLAVEYPLSQASQRELKQLQESLMLKDDDIDVIQRQLTLQAEVKRKDYQKKLQQYHQEFRACLEQEMPLSDANRQRLTQYWRSLALDDSDVTELEHKLIEQAQAQQEAYNQRLKQFEQVATTLVQQTAMPLNEETRNALWEIKDSLNLKDADADAIQKRIFAQHEAELLQAVPAPPPPQDLSSSDLAPEQFQPPPPTASTHQPVLASERNLDYSRLALLLERGSWKQADAETLNMMLKATGRESEGWLSPEAIQAFPCIDLTTINNLWERHSHGKFGFTTQAHIYDNLITAPNIRDGKKSVEFGKSVKWVWVVGGSLYSLFKPYDQLDFSDNAPNGHLPALWFWQLSLTAALRCGTLGSTRGLGGSDIKMLSNLFQRLRECKIR